MQTPTALQSELQALANQIKARNSLTASATAVEPPHRTGRPVYAPGISAYPDNTNRFRPKAARMSAARIVTSYVYPPIPERCFDWSASFDGYEPGDPIGRGPTEEAAIEELQAQVDEDGGAT